MCSKISFAAFTVGMAACAARVRVASAWLGWAGSRLARASEAARRLDMATKELLRLIRDRKIRYVMAEGIAHVPVDAIED